MTYLIALGCALLSGAAFYSSTGLGSFWPLAWLAPIPVLWLAFKEARGWTVFFAALAAAVLGGLNLLVGYAADFPPPVLAVLAPAAILLPALLFALAVMGARLVAQRVSPPAAIAAFAALWTAFDYLLSSLGPNGAALSPAYSQVGMPYLIQGASIFGVWVVSFVLGFFAAGIAMAVATRRAAPAVLAAALLLADGAYGLWRISTAPATASVLVGLAADDALIAKRFQADETSALAVVEAYAGAGRELTANGANLLVVPERVAVLEPAWRGEAMANLETVAHIGHATLVIGFDERGAERRNGAVIFFANGAPPQTYFKRHLVPGLERAFVPGTASFMLADRTGIAICKDMDFPAMLRRDAVLEPTLYAVPAWDFGKDRWWHARLAIMRGVENGFSVARAANDGLLTLSDAYGRVLAEKPSRPGGMVTLLGVLPRGPGHTLYARVGDAFAWVAAALAVLLLGVALAAPKRTQSTI